jgi:poly-gamma-glutamate capsule biosynthesis protein CapA/YwtB (metallophosphatase superfamily)
VRLCLAGDTMLGRHVAARLGEVSPAALFADEVVDAIGEADLFVVNLECAVSERGERWPDPFKRFFFRAPPAAVEVLRYLGVGCVTLANNHTLDYGAAALLDTIHYLEAAGIGWVGAGIDARGARSPIVIERADVRLGIVAVADHPPEYDAGVDRPGIAYADLRRGLPPWLRERIGRLDADAVLVSPHWGPNMVAEPVAHVRAVAAAFLDAGASLVAGHSAHVFHGVGHRVLYDLGDFIDDYACDPDLHNELGLLWFVTFDGATPTRVEALPLAVDNCHTRLADRHEAGWICDRFRRACAAMGTTVGDDAGRLVIEWAR